MEPIKLNARYGYVHYLKHVDKNLWVLEPDKKSGGYFRIIGNPVVAIDPDGGPFIAVGDNICGYFVKSITHFGVLELIKLESDKNEES